MSSLLLILLSAVLVCHYAPALFGMRLFEDADAGSASRGLALASFILIVILAPASYAIERTVLQPFDVQYLRTFVLVLLILIFAPLVAAAIEKSGRWKPVRPALSLMLVGNALVLGSGLLVAGASSALAAIGSGVGIGAAFAVLLVAFTAMHARVVAAPIPHVFRDAPVALITTGLMALALMGLIGLVRE